MPSAILREIYKDHISRGLNSSKVSLGIMDSLAGLEKDFGEQLFNDKIQHCQVHITKNVLAKVPKKQKKKVANDIRRSSTPLQGKRG